MVKKVSSKKKKVSNKKIHNTASAPNKHYKNKVVNKHNGRQWQIQTKRGR